jgi:hypothetical protein
MRKGWMSSWKAADPAVRDLGILAAITIGALRLWERSCK